MRPHGHVSGTSHQAHQRRWLDPSPGLSLGFALLGGRRLGGRLAARRLLGRGCLGRSLGCSTLPAAVDLAAGLRRVVFLGAAASAGASAAALFSAAVDLAAGLRRVVFLGGLPRPEPRLQHSSRRPSTWRPACGASSSWARLPRPEPQLGLLPLTASRRASSAFSSAWTSGGTSLQGSPPRVCSMGSIDMADGRRGGVGEESRLP